MSRWFKFFAYLASLWIGFRADGKRNERHETIDDDPDTEWERRFGRVRNDTNDATDNGASSVQDRTTSSGSSPDEQRDLDKPSKSD